MGFWTAWQFLTIFPGMPAKDEIGGRLGGSLPFFPVVGLILGGALLGLDRLFDLFLPPLPTAALLVASMLVLSGALHLDGFMDTCDGFAVKSSREECLRAMADSRVGGFGVAGGICLLLIKFAAIASLPEGLRSAALLLTPAIARGAVTTPILVFPSAREGGLGDLFRKGTSGTMIPITAALTLSLGGAFLEYGGLALAAVVWGLAWLAGWGLHRRLGGLTGDTYGAIIEFSEVIVLIGMFIIEEAGGTSWLGLS